MERAKKLPVGDSSFERMREEDLLYVDKTRHIHRMLSEGMFYFVARPRRFGKSLTVSTIRCLFQGRKDLFDGLWIGERGGLEWKEHPTVLIDEYDKPLIDHLGKGKE